MFVFRQLGMLLGQHFPRTRNRAFNREGVARFFSRRN